MSLKRDQKRELDHLSEHLKKIEKLTVENSIDLDVFVTDYNRHRFSIYMTEKIGLKANTQKRKNIFIKQGTENPQGQTTIK